MDEGFRRQEQGTPVGEDDPDLFQAALEASRRKPGVHAELPEQWRLHTGAGDAQCQICGKNTKVADLYKPDNASRKSKYGSEGAEFGACCDSCLNDLQDRIIMEDLWGKFEDIDRMLSSNANKLVAGYKSNWENANPHVAISKFFVLMAGTARSLAKLMRESGFDAKPVSYTHLTLPTIA